jgi:hypothetical protein
MAEAATGLREILDAAERAAAAEDFVSAEQHLRQAAILQEQQLGGRHPDLANTLNNLGIVSEYVGKPAEAETCYRRAYRIASAALPADHPLVQTSGQNLKDFCAAIGKAPDLPQPLPPEPVPPDAVPPELESFAPEPAVDELRLNLAAPPAPSAVPPAANPAVVVHAPRADEPTAPPDPLVIRELPLRSAEDVAPAPPARSETAIRLSSPVSAHPSRPTTAIAIVALLVLAAAAWWFGLREPSPVASDSPVAEATVPSQEPPAATSLEEQVVVPPEPTAPSPTAVDDPQAAPVPIEKPPIAQQPPTRAATAPTNLAKDAPSKSAGSSGLSVAEAKVCRSLSTANWACTAATNPASPGAFFFYTRVRSASDTTVQHRWLVDGRLLRTVSLRIRANPGAGYRTYSRNTVTADRRGNWTIELRDAGGALLHEERFVVQ